LKLIKYKQESLVCRRMRDTDYTSLRREFLTVGLTGAMVGLAGCSDSVTIEAGSDDEDTDENDESTETPDIDTAGFSFSYDEAAKQARVEFTGGAAIDAGNVQIRHDAGREVLWAELGSTTAGPEEDIETGAVAVLGPEILNWEAPIESGETIRLIYTGKETPATLERYTPPGETDTGTTVPASISEFSIDASSDQQLRISFIADKQLETFRVTITGAESHSLTMTDFSEQQTDSRSYQYEATVTVGSDGTYRATLDEATDISGRDSTSGQRITDTTDLTTSAEDTTSPRIDAFSIAAPSSQSLRISFDSSERLSTIRVRITGQESTTLSESDFTVTETGSENYTYEATFTINSEGTFTAKLNRASDSSGNNGAVGQEVSITTDTKQNETKTGGIDGFEDGNIDEYSGMTGGFQPQQSVVKNGDWALKGQVQSGDNQHLYREFDSSQPERVQGYIRVEASTDGGGLENAHIQYHSGGSSGDSILHINFFLDSNNDNQSRPRLEINGEKVTENISFSTWYYVELSDIDWETETVGSVTVDDATVAQNVPFENSASTVDTLHLKVNDNNFGNEIAYFDDITIF
jgi:hypothetical protein